MTTTILPPKRAGLTFHGAAMLILIGGCVWSWNRATQSPVGWPFYLFLAQSLAFALPIPLAAYRAYALFRAAYLLSPEGVRLHWGLRVEDIPMERVLWISPDEQLERPLPKPWLRWPGAVLGVRRVGGGEVEYMAARSRGLVVIATPEKLFAISPESPQEFLTTFARCAEFGTLQPMPARSLYPTVLIGAVWANRAARYAILGGLALSLVLLLWATLAVPENPNLLIQISDGANGRTITGTQIFLISILNALFYLFDLLLGLFFYRQEESRPLAFLLWGGSALTSLLIFGAFIPPLHR